MFKRENIAWFCLMAGTILGGFARFHRWLYIITVISYLIALAIDVPSLVEEYKKWKRKKQQ